LHELKRTEEAYDLLLPVVHKCPSCCTIPYNLACYCEVGLLGMTEPVFLYWRGDKRFECGVDKTTTQMAKALSKSQTAAALAEKTGLTKKQSAQFLDELAALAYKNAKNSFTIPGLGKLVLVQRKARMGRNPATGETIKIAAKKVVKFRVAKAAKVAILGK
jgi:DNA-binding protein HU-beta